ncbi:indolepyruvate ferredoxin oxidoreductase family protein [Candidatus Poriferisodalis sp.]|uniref:indolepyruvate ferredoxin oxidoreductase family protein n=1 Tax=Candidatus Poriferisodalis sp. TaxID=3101277 RepID=UPI003B01BC19
MSLAETYRLTDRYTDERGTAYMTGLQALARLPLEQLRADRRAGLRTAAFVSGYPGSPLGGYDAAIEAARRTTDLPVVHSPAVNEEQAATAVMGSQLAAVQPDAVYDGVLGLWYGKAPGVDRATDALRHGVFAGADPRGGAVVIAGDDPAAKSSTIPSSSAGSLADLHIPVLYPGTPAEALDLGRHAIAMSRTTGLWTGLKIVADVADGASTVRLDPDRFDPVIPLLDGEPYRHRPDGYLLTPHTVDLEREIVEVRYELAIAYAAANRLNAAAVDPPDAWIALVASGITCREVREALRRLGLDSDEAVRDAGIRLVRMGMPIPFSAERARRFARGVTEVFVIEEKSPNIESLLKDALYNQSHHPRIVGKADEHDQLLLHSHGALTADDLVEPLRRRLEARIGERLAPAQPERVRIELPLALSPEQSRSPYFCSGCPHNRSTQVPDGAVVGAGIGCHTMALLMAPQRVGDITGVTAMGQEGTQWIGMSPFVKTRHIFQNLGDGTYFHSGRLAVAGAVASGANITYKLLWNRAVAMTGGQDPAGQLDVPEVAAALLAGGVAKILITTDDPAAYRGRRRSALPDGVEVWHRDRLMEAQELLADIDGVTVLVHDQQCAAEARRARKRGTQPTPTTRVLINERICEGCGDCGAKSNCLSVQPVDTFFGRKTRIDQTSCNFDYSCLDGDCPSFVTVSEPGPLRRRLRMLLAAREQQTAHGRDGSKSTRPEPPAELADPVPLVGPDEVSVRMCGIGGTGVVTAAQVLGTAAMFDGYEVRGLDQIGLSQKAGPVVGDLRLQRAGGPATARLGRGQADVIVAFDLLVAASPAGLEVADPERTMVVGSTSPTPTGAMVADPNIPMPAADALLERLAAVTVDGRRHWADVNTLADALCGSAVTSNVFVVGMAVQAGALPVSPAAVEAAIELNGVAVARNLAAFRWGRAMICDPASVTAAAAGGASAAANGEKSCHESATVSRSLPAQLPEHLSVRIDQVMSHLRAEPAPDVPAPDLGRLGETLRRYAAELGAYQSQRLCEQFLDAVERVASVDGAAGDGTARLTAAAAAGHFKLAAYKDEYEVARLMADTEANAAARSLAATVGGTVSWNLHPPMLRALGCGRKIRFSAAWRPVFALLARGKCLRGRWCDPFGHTQIRRTERALPAEYATALESALQALERDAGAARYEQAVSVAELAQLVRGYEQVKMATVATFRSALAEHVAALTLRV